MPTPLKHALLLHTAHGPQFALQATYAPCMQQEGGSQGLLAASLLLALCPTPPSIEHAHADLGVSLDDASTSSTESDSEEEEEEDGGIEAGVKELQQQQQLRVASGAAASGKGRIDGGGGRGGGGEAMETDAARPGSAGGWVGAEVCLEWTRPSKCGCGSSCCIGGWAQREWRSDAQFWG